MTIPSVSDDKVAQALGAALGTQYQVVRLLGRGGMGTVYLAREPFLDRDVAVKVLPSDLASGDARERFLREARTAARLSHPNIVPLYTFGQAGELLYYVMGFVDGESLEARLKREGRISFDDARRITSELADALDYAHQLGVVHRDVKPDNVLLDRHTGRAMLTDFGIAKQRATQETLTQTGVIIGTPHYMSPEQASGDREIDGRSDIYSLGIIAYRMVTGRLPFEGAGMRDVLAQHATRAPVPPSRLITSLPLDIDTVITRALEKEPAQRWPNARSVREALSPDSEEAVPDDLRTIAGMGIRMAVVGAVFAEAGIVGWIFDFFDLQLAAALTGLGALVQVIAPLGMIAPARKFGWRAALQSYFRQPSWWTGWYPKFFRRTADVWDRLPKQIRFLRSASLGLSVVGVVFFHVMFYYMRQDYLSVNPGQLSQLWWFWPMFWGYMGATYGGLIYGALRLRKWIKATGLSKHDAARFTSEATFGSAFWSKPHIAALLGSPIRGQSSASAPRDAVAEIERTAREGAASPHADLYREAAEGARALGAAIGRAHDELAQLARDADPQEHARIKESLGRTAEPKMRELLERQLQLYQELESRRADARERSDRLVEQLRTLALHVAHLRAQNAMDSAAASEITGRIHAICRGIDYRIEGVQEVRNLVIPTSEATGSL